MPLTGALCPHTRARWKEPELALSTGILPRNWRISRKHSVNKRATSEPNSDRNNCLRTGICSVAKRGFERILFWLTQSRTGENGEIVGASNSRFCRPGGKSRFSLPRGRTGPGRKLLDACTGERLYSEGAVITRFPLTGKSRSLHPALTPWVRLEEPHSTTPCSVEGVTHPFGPHRTRHRTEGSSSSAAHRVAFGKGGHPAPPCPPRGASADAEDSWVAPTR